jgi:hypothetical protein
MSFRMSTAAVRTPDAYSVPRKFSLRAVLMFMGLFAVLLALVRMAELPPSVPIFYMVFLALIAVSQMVFERSPRAASMLTGVVYLPVCHLLAPDVREHLRFSPIGENLLIMAVVGGFLAYLGGTLAAGAFLVSDLMRRSGR